MVGSEHYKPRYVVDRAALAPSTYKIRYPANLQYETHQIQKLYCFSSRLAVVFAQSIEARG